MPMIKEQWDKKACQVKGKKGSLEAGQSLCLLQMSRDWRKQWQSNKQDKK